MHSKLCGCKQSRFQFQILEQWPYRDLNGASDIYNVVTERRQLTEEEKLGSASHTSFWFSGVVYLNQMMYSGIRNTSSGAMPDGSPLLPPWDEE